MKFEFTTPQFQLAPVQQPVLGKPSLARLGQGNHGQGWLWSPAQPQAWSSAWFGLKGPQRSPPSPLGTHWTRDSIQPGLEHFMDVQISKDA